MRKETCELFIHVYVISTRGEKASSVVKMQDNLWPLKRSIVENLSSIIVTRTDAKNFLSFHLQGMLEENRLSRKHKLRCAIKYLFRVIGEEL